MVDGCLVIDRSDAQRSENFLSRAIIKLMSCQELFLVASFDCG
jgi:hypothetical protein